MNEDKKIVLSKEEEIEKVKFLSNSFVSILWYIIEFIKSNNILQEKEIYLQTNDRIYDMWYHFSVKYSIEAKFKEFFFKEIFFSQIKSLEVNGIMITKENYDTIDLSEIGDRMVNRYTSYEINYHEYEDIFKNIIFYYSNNTELDNLLIEIKNDMKFDTFWIFQNYFNLYRSENNKKFNLLNKELSNLKDSLMIDFFDKWIFKWEILPNGKKYIKLEKWDIDKINNHPDVIAKKEELNKVFNSDNYWFSGLSINNLYKSIENIFLFKIRDERQKHFLQEHNFIDKKVFILSLKKFDEVCNYYIKNKDKIVYNKNTKKELEWKNIKDIIFYFIDYRKNTLWPLKYNIFLTEKDIEKQNNYNTTYSSIKDDIIKEWVYSKESRYLDRQITNKIRNNPELQKIYKDNKNIQNKKREIDNFLWKIDEFDRLYEEYKKDYILNNSTLKSSRDIEDYNDIILYNNHIDRINFSDYYTFKFRLYNYTEFEFWGSTENNEYLRWVMIAKDIEDLIEKINFQYNVISFDWRWDKEKRENNLYKKLWIKEKVLISQINKSDLKYVLCWNCWRPYVSKEWKCWDYYCNKEVELRKLEEINKENKISNSDDISIKKFDWENWLDLLDNVIDDNKDIEKENIKITINTTDAVIYRILNKENWFSYIWKTEQTFATRWWQHFSPWNNSSPFAQDLKDYWLSSFNFEILEEINKENIGLSSVDDFLKYILIREQYYIDLHNSFEAGYNRRNNFKKTKAEIQSRKNKNNLSLDF